MDSEREIAHLTTQYAGTEINMIQDYKGVNKLVSFCLPNCFWKLWNHPRQLLRIKLYNHFILVFLQFCLFDSCLFVFIFCLLFVLFCLTCICKCVSNICLTGITSSYQKNWFYPKCIRPISKWIRCYKMIWTFCSTGQDIHDLPPGMLFFTARGWIVSP